MKKIFFFLTAAIVAMSVSAAPVDLTTATQKAQSFLSEYYAGKMMAPAATQPVLLKAEVGDVMRQQPVYYIFNTSTTFLVIAGDDRAEEILMVGDRPLKNVNDLPWGLRDMLGQYKDQIMFLQDHPGLQPNNYAKPSTPMLNATTYGPLLTCNWDQEAPYYNQCKFGSYQCLTGCPATSASMVFYYWKYPTAATPTVPGYKSTISYSSYGSKSYTHSALPSTTFDWDNMLDSYTGSYTTAQGTAVATLMHYVGQAERMGYGTSAAGGSGVSVDSVCNIRDAFTFFGYNSSTTRFVKKTSAYSGGTTLYSDSQWASMIQEEMAAGRPIVFCAVSSNAGGHAFNVDGYNSSTNKYHINFGWSGEGNAWCALNSFGYSSYNFNVYQQMVIGIQPPSGSTATPTLTVSPTSLSFSTTVGTSVSKTFTVTGSNLTGNVTLTKTDANSAYTISPTTITASAAASGATVTVTYNPSAAGTQTGSIAIASSGATSKTVSLSGTATAAALTTYTPVMSAANSNYITSSSFRADWTDQTASANVTSYTLQVDKEGSSTPSTEVTLLGTIDGSNYTGSYKTITLSSPWGGTSVKGGNSAVYTSGSSGKITFTIPSGYSSNTTFSVQITTVTGTYGSGNITVKSTQTSALGHSFSKGETYTWTVTGKTGDVITIYSTDSSYSPDMSMIKVYAGNINLNASESGDATSRTITGITNKYYTVSNLTAGATYNYKVKALYTDGTSSAWSNVQSVTLSEEQQTATPTLTVTPTSLSMSANVGATKTATFKVTGADLTGNVTLTLNDANGVFSISPTTITAANAANGVNVTVTYAPTAYGTQTATVTVASSGATSKTVSLTGSATIGKSNPVLNAATNISSTGFTATWSHDVESSTVSSYSLYATRTAVPSGDDPEPESTLLGSLDGSNYTGSYASITLSSPWGGSNVKAGNGAIYTKNSTSWWGSSTTYGTITYTVPSGYTNATFTVQITTANNSYGAGNITVKSAKTSAVGYSCTKGNTYTWTVTASAGDKITIYSTDSSYSPDMTWIGIYAGTLNFNASVSGDQSEFVVTDIDAGTTGITLSNLTEGATYSYYVVANYVDGTTGTSNTQEVTLVTVTMGNTTGINSLTVDGDEVESVTYVNLSGVQSKEPWDGVNIVVTRYRSGAVKSSKVRY
ncbi:MAG: C10 family peptidase [Muribaculaceae bacterium]|nr:C10 family peptidase [Muribaculaceae bacterium]